MPETQELKDRLVRKAKVAPTIGGGSIGSEGKATSYIIDDGMRLVNPDGPEALSRINALEEGLRKIAKQRLSDEMGEDEWEGSDWLGGYNCCVLEARRALLTQEDRDGE